MAKKRPTTDQMAAMLQQPHFAPPASNPAAPVALVGSDPIMPTPMVLDVEQVKTYDHNPRRVPNSEYQAIYESVEANGLDQALTITRRPGDTHYMVFAGGNTRLEIVQRLWRETADPKYQKLNVLFRPWSSELETLLAHLRENDQRGDLTFIDRAYALVELRQMLEQELGLGAENAVEIAENVQAKNMPGASRQCLTPVGTETAKRESLSNGRFAELLKERGYSIHRDKLHLYWYAVDELADCIPGLLKHGAGRPLIKDIYLLDKAYMATFRFLNAPPDADPPATEEEARQIFHTLLQRMDAEGELDLDYLRNLLKKELSVTFDQTFSTCGMLMLRMEDADGAEGLEWFWTMDAEDRERDAARELREQQAQVQADAVTGQDEPSAALPLPAFQQPSGQAVPAADFHLQSWEPGTADTDEGGTSRQETRSPTPPATPGPAANPHSRDARANTFNLLLDEDEDPDEGGMLDGLDDDLGSALDTRPAGPVDLPGRAPSASPMDALQNRLGNSNYSFSVAETLELPLPAMPQTLPELRQRMVELARELFNKARLGSNMIHPIPSGVGFIVMPVTRPIAEDFDGLPPGLWTHAMHLWQEMTEFSQQFLHPSPAHRFIPQQWRDTFPNFTEAMERAEWDDRLFYDYRLEDWGNWGKEMPYLSGFHGREARAFRIFASPDFGSVSLAYYMQLVETYRALHGLVQGDIWRDA